MTIRIYMWLDRPVGRWLDREAHQASSEEVRTRKAMLFLENK